MSPDPWLALEDKEFGIETKESAKEEELKDFQILAEDMLRFLIYRTNVLDRITYLLLHKNEALTECGVTSILKILIRVARHSPDVLIEFDELLGYFVENNVSPNWTTLGMFHSDIRCYVFMHLPIFCSCKIIIL